MVILTFLVCTINASVKEEHQVRYLNSNDKFNHYAGYLNVSETRKLSYWLFESQNAPKTDPLILWLHGGPGCSSFYGAVIENGPLLLPQGDGKDLVFKENPHAYNTFANVLYLEGPAYTGFSINKEDNYTHSDDKTADDNFEFLKRFLVEYPEYKSRDFYVAGISYAGCYVPYLANKILDEEGALDLSLKGVILGNAVTKREWWDKFQLPSLVFNGIENPTSLAKWEKKYCPKGFDYFCGKELMGSPNTFLVRPLNAYDLTQPCYSGGACEGDSMDRFFNQPKVKEALHMDDVDWVYCDRTLQMEFNQNCDDPEPYVRRILDDGIKVLYFYGSTDAICPTFEGEFFTRKIGGIRSKIRMNVWYVDEQVAGIKTTYPNGLTYTTIIGAGHAAALAKPKQVKRAITKFITCNDDCDWSNE
uniref:Peptidase S10, serine carboxypeptidase, Alpha/Beta hydrolase fold protein n=1 Tax=Bursaphelenchus xylophilus TaxID=6326 RepID=A0A1I7S9D9_BURXY